jgi:hypothetical protein
LVALPAVATFNAFTRYVESALSEAEALRHEILAYVKGRTHLGLPLGPQPGEAPAASPPAANPPTGNPPGPRAPDLKKAGS